jgi:hypothetical protein
MRRIAIAAIAAGSILTSTFGPAHAGFTTADEAPAIATSDADLMPHLKRQQSARTALYEAVHRREWAGAAAGAIEVASRRTPRRGAPSAGPAPTPTTPASSAGGTVWDQLAQCESGGDWSIATGNGFFGGLQFTLSSWQAVGGQGMPNHASREEQIARGQALQAIQGWGAWPACSAKLGLR